MEEIHEFIIGEVLESKESDAVKSKICFIWPLKWFELTLKVMNCIPYKKKYMENLLKFREKSKLASTHFKENLSTNLDMQY